MSGRARAQLATERGLLGAGLFLTGLDHRLVWVITTGLLATVALAPVWVGCLGRYRGARWVVGLVPCVLVAGALLAALGSRPVVVRNGLETAVLLVAAAGTVGLLLAARRVMPVDAAMLCYATGLVLEAARHSPGSTNAFKYHLGVPLALVVLAALARRRLRWQVLALVGLAGLGVAFEYRSYAGYCLLTGLLMLWQARRRTGRPPTGIVTSAALLVVLTVGLYFTATAVLERGWLGATLQERSLAQVHSAGSLLLGGRPEWAATLELMHRDPRGLGLGVVPLPQDVIAAKQALLAVGVPASNHYPDNFMFDGHVKLHSVVADLWSAAGPVGLLLGLSAAALLGHALLTLVSRRDAAAVVVLSVLLALWDLGFGPIHSNLPDIAVGLGLVLLAAPSGAAPGRGRPGRQRTAGSGPVQPRLDPVPVGAGWPR